MIVLVKQAFRLTASYGSLYSLQRHVKNHLIRYFALASFQYSDVTEEKPFHKSSDIKKLSRKAVLNHNNTKQIIEPFTREKKLDKSLDSKKFGDIGQPTPVTHPHFFTSQSHATPGITHEEYASRRRKLMILLSQSDISGDHERHVAIIPAASLKIMSNDIPYPFHQDNDFLYLTGINEPDAVLVLAYNKTSGELQSLLFVKPKDPHRELWDGPVIGLHAAKEYFRFGESLPLSSLQNILKTRYSCDSNVIWLNNLRKDCKNFDNIRSFVNASHFKKKGLHTFDHNLQMLRLLKSDAEINLSKKSASIAANSFIKVMQNTREGLLESQLQALFEFYCRSEGADRLSFPPVVAGGNRANTLHYINNTQLLKSGDLVLMDAGCEYNGYASDITRTWPVNGKFTPEQKQVYEIVLDVQKICLQECRVGMSIEELHQLMLLSLGKKLQEIGFLQRNLSEEQLRKVAQKFCPHHVGHYLGMDTHDTMLLHRRLPLQPGMMFTVEPGLYIPYTAKVPSRYHGIGVRIEDDVIMTENGAYVLSAELPKEVEELENIVASAK